MRHNKAFSFWLLAIEDPEWLAKHLCPGGRAPKTFALPATASDREALATDADLALTNSPRVATNAWEAAIRAFYRDREWLDAQVAACKHEELEEQREILTDLVEAERCNWEVDQIPPKRFNLRVAASRLGWSTKTLATKIQNLDLDPFPCLESLDEYRARALRWAIDQQLAQGQTLAPTALCKLVGFSSEGATLAAARTVLYDYKGIVV